MRIEHDGFGDLELSDDVYYGSVAERHRVCFPVGPFDLDDYPEYVQAVALIKIACARANAEIGALDAVKARYIEAAGREVADGKFSGNFCINIFRGSGTPLNAAVNEVIAHRANELMTGDKTLGGIHPNTHVNMGQSSNDVIPSAKDIVIYWELERLIGAAGRFASALEKRATETAMSSSLDGQDCRTQSLKHSDRFWELMHTVSGAWKAGLRSSSVAGITVASAVRRSAPAWAACPDSEQ